MGKVMFYETDSGEKEIIGNIAFRLGDGEEEEGTSEDEDNELRSYLSNVPEETIREIIRYRDTLPVVGPYKIDFMPKIPLLDAVGPINSEKFPRYYERAMLSLQFAIDQYNKDKASKLELDEVVRVNMRTTSGFLFYITFEAKDSLSGKTDVYCTQVWDDVVDKQMTVYEFFKENDVKAAADAVSSTKTS